jgi:hypothetical protein
MTRAQVLKHCLAYALSKLRFKRAPLGIPEDARMQLADEAVKELRRFGHWKELDEDAGTVEPLWVNGAPRETKDD